MYFKSALILVAFMAVASGLTIGKSSSRLNSLFLAEGSCAGRCNQTGTIPGDCQCNKPCVGFGDCCPDYDELCNGGVTESCAGRCGQSGTVPGTCQCNKPCENFGDCCPDYDELCGATGGPITDAELSALAEQLLSLDNTNNVASFITLDLQGETTSGSSSDKAPLPLMTVAPGAYEPNTIKLLMALQDNYEPNVGVAEVVTAEEKAEEQRFIDAVFATPIMQTTQAFLQSKGLPTGRANFEEIWFGLYSRSGSTLGSSGFEHIFVGEHKSGVSGFHNWVFFATEEAQGDVNYRGWMKTFDLGTRGSIIEHSFTWQGQNKPVSSMYVGTSPELELALNTVCFHARPNAKCRVTLNGSPLGIQTYDISGNGGKKFVASAYPDLSD